MYNESASPFIPAGTLPDYYLPRAGVLVATEGAPREENLLPTTLSVWKFRTWGFNNLLWARSRTSLSALNFSPSQVGLFVTNLFTSGPVSSSESSLSSELVYSMLRNNQSLCWNTTRKSRLLSSTHIENWKSKSSVCICSRRLVCWGWE